MANERENDPDLASAEGERRLATIVALDVAGYSSRTERDENRAVREVATLRPFIEAIAHAHSGRIFNTAGDGFMLEFPSSLAAVNAALELAERCEPKVRVGVHLGDVVVQPNGDLLGHGVNVASRVMSRSAPGAALVSGSVRQTLRGPLEGELIPQGVVHLDKMALSVEVYRIVPRTRREGLSTGERPARWRTAAAGAVLLLLILGGTALYLTRSGNAPEPPQPATAPSMRVAIIPFDVVGTGSDAARTFADTLLDKIVDALSANQVETVSRADSLSLRGEGSKASAALAALRVGLTLEGSVQNDGKTITVRLHLDDVRQHVTLWSKEFEGPVESPEPLQTQVALHATDVTGWAVSPRLKGVRSDPSLVAAYLEGEDEDKNGGGGRSLAIAQDLVSRAPRFAAAHTLLASAVGQENGLEVVTPEARAESSREAKIAIALDGGDGQAYALLARTLPILSLKEREELLLKGLLIEPGSASANWEYIFEILADTGRTEEAIAQARSAWHLAPFTEWIAFALPLTLGNAGRTEEARKAIAEMNRKWPDNPDVLFRAVEFTVESQVPPFTRALALLDDTNLRDIWERPPYGEPGATGILRAVLRARAGSLTQRRATSQLVEKSADDGVISAFVGISSLASLGDVDGAFRVADRALTTEQLHRLFGSDAGDIGSAYLLFGAQTAAMRHDRRFMQLAQRLGLADYWRSTGHWPDFCSEPGLPYDCKAEVARLAAIASPHAKN